MLQRIQQALWGNLTSEELKKFGILSAILMLILGSYWMLRTMKNAIFNDLVGFEWQPRAKILTLVVMVFLVLFYSKLVDLFEKHKLFYILCTFFGSLLIILGYLVAHPHLATLAPTSFAYPAVAWIPGKALGWISYVLLESYGSLIIGLFWAFVASVTQTESAKRGYPLIIFITQIGTISGAVLVNAQLFHLSSLVMLGGILILVVPILIKLYLTYIPKEESFQQPNTSAKKNTGFFEGLKLLATRPYVMGVFVISTVYEVIGTIMEFQMNMIAKGIFPTSESFAAFNAKLGIGINTLALIFALVGTSFFLRKFGLRFCLTAYPFMVGIAVGSVFLFKMIGASNLNLMWAFFLTVIAIKGFSYALNNPTKEVLYIPTSKDVRFKAKGWIEMFGSRSAKGTGSAINDIFRTDLSALLTYGSIMSLGIVGVWVVIAAWLGTSYNKLQQENKTIE